MIGDEQKILPNTVKLYTAVYYQQEISIVKHANDIQLNITN
jgi:hypothetical protein